MGPPRKGPHSGLHGHGPTIPRFRFAIPTTGLARGSGDRGKFAPWYLKHWGSRPIAKRIRRLAEVA